MSAELSFGPAYDYWIDAWQRAILTLDVLRERGNIYQERKDEAAPHVLSFDAELVLDGRTLPRPVNYVLVRMPPPADTPSDPAKPPFIIVDPRAGHGPGIGGMKADSEIGMALAAGHACYFVGFLPEPMEGQTIEDVCAAEARFVQEVASRHPDADGKPVIVANCQAGWQTMIMAALNPDLPGPILLAGSPLSYWAGVRGKNPMRYTGGVLGGTWLTALAGDMGAGRFDGANLVANFESLNPANTYWQKPYNLYSKVDTERSRFLDFETWWGSPVLLNAQEMQWIADNLFVGNRLTSGELSSSDGVRIDLRNIRSPIVVFCSWGDDITPPQQALGWITDLYADEREIVANGQTLVYTLHETVGHLGIFVSGSVATKEHAEFTSCMDMIDLMPPGLYEAVITEVGEDTANPELIDGRYLFRLEPRTLDHIRALGENPPEDERRFEAAARVSEVNLALYRTLAAPIVRAMSTPASADAMRALHPNRLRFGLLSDLNPFMSPVQALADVVRENRRQVAEDNPLRAMEANASAWISAVLEAGGAARDRASEQAFLSLYGSPIVQASVGVTPGEPSPDQGVGRDLARDIQAARFRAELEGRFEAGDEVDAALRALIYVRAGEGADERTFALLRAFRKQAPAADRLPLAELKGRLKTQFLLVKIDEARAVGGIPGLLPASADERRALLDGLENVLAAPGPLSPEGRGRLARIEALFNVKAERPSPTAAGARNDRKQQADPGGS